jgi:hypothetical protein
MKRYLTNRPCLECLEIRDLPTVSFAPAAFVPAPQAAAVAVGDFNGDHIPDLAAVSWLGDEVSVRLGRGNGTFGFARSFPLPNEVATAVAVGDFNNDGRLDLAVAAESTSLYLPNYGNVNVLLGNGDGTFQPARNLSAGEGPQGLALGDFNGDGKLDIVVANADAGDVGLFLGNGDGTFRNLGGHDAGSYPCAVVAGDFNRDGRLDFAVANAGSNNVGVFLGNGNGTFRNLGGFATGADPRALVVGDFNGDGIPDLATANVLGNTVSVLLGKGDGTFRPAINFPTGGTGPVALATADFNRDGRLDLVVANAGSDTAAVLLGNGNGTFQPAQTFAIDSYAHGIAAADLNRDALPDVVTADISSGDLSVLLNQAPTFTTLSASVNPAVTGQVVTYTATVRSTVPGGPVPTGLVSFFVNGNYSMQQTLDVNGQARISFAAYPGSRSLTAVYAGDGTHTTSTSPSWNEITIKDATTVALSPSASLLLFGQPFTVRVTVSAAAPGSGPPGGSVTFYRDGSAVASAILSGRQASYTFRGLTRGLHTFRATYSGDDYYFSVESPTLTLIVR